MNDLTYLDLDSPIGRMRLVATRDALVECNFVDARPRPADALPSRSGHAVLDVATKQLAAFFRGEDVRFTAPLAPSGTDFQHRVWRAIAAIPRGATRTYAEIALAAGATNGANSARAAGAAAGRNPIAILVPCHRVVGANGALTGYAGGLERKRWLLDHECARDSVAAASPR